MDPKRDLLEIVAREAAATAFHGHENFDDGLINKRLSILGHNLRKVLKNNDERTIFRDIIVSLTNCPPEDYLDYDLLAVISMKMVVNTPAFAKTRMKFNSQFNGKICFECGSTAKVPKKCKACGMVYYCSKKCQKKNWRSQHKDECKAFARIYIPTRPPLFSAEPK